MAAAIVAAFLSGGMALGREGSRDEPGIGNCGSLDSRSRVLQLIADGRSEDAIPILKSLCEKARRDVLGEPDIVEEMASRASYATLDLIEALGPDARTAVLATPGAVFGLASRGHAAAVIAMIEKLPAEAQQKILAARSARWGLTAYGGQWEAIDRINEKWNRPQPEADGPKP